jgi:hypothetical protein
MVEGYCVKCKKSVEISAGKETKTSNGRRMMKGKCPKCTTTVCKFLPNK